MATKLSGGVAPLVSMDISATVSMGFATEDFIADSITRTDFDMDSAGIMGRWPSLRRGELNGLPEGRS